nr:hypothetical protein F49H6.10 - Caenorhabditis elegans [Caenorhabditis elegans]
MNTTLDFSYIPDSLTNSSVASLVTCFIISYLTLPFYCYVHKLRRHKEKSLHIVQLFYKVVKLSYFVFTFLIFIGIMFKTVFRNILQPDLNPNSFIKTVYGIISLPICLLMYILHILQQTFHFLLLSLAIMSYLKYQFPYDFLYSQNYTSKYVRKLNVFFALKDFVRGVIHYCERGNLLPTPFIYIPIIVGMRKNRHLHSQQHIYIHEYMFIQSIMVLLLKIVCFYASIIGVSKFVFQITVPVYVYFFNADITFGWPFSMIITDVITTPWIIQLSYLRCNLNELYTLFTSFNFFKFLKIVFGRMDATVHSIVHPIAFSIT